MSKYEELIQKDLEYIWHPFTQMKDFEEHKPIVIDHGKGIYVYDLKGNKYIDAVASWWVNTLGHSNDRLNKALCDQANKIEHILLAGFTHEPAITLAQKLVEISPEPLKKVFFSDNGSTAVEVAIKMAYQYWVQVGKPEKSKFVAIKNSYHGDTLGVVSIGGCDLFHKLYKPLLFDIEQSPSPYCYRCPMGKEKGKCNFECAYAVEDILKKESHNIAGMVVEPMIQGSGGMIIYPPEYLKIIRELCDKYDILLIDDEVAMGFGRTGKFVACEHADITPDIMCLAKGITAGYMPLAVTLCTQKIYDAFYDDYEKTKTFYHGHSFTGNPLACAVAVENLKILEEEKIFEKNQPKIKHFGKKLQEFYKLPNVGDVRHLGMIGAVEIVKDKKTKEPFPFEKRVEMEIYREGLKNGIIMRPMGNTFYFMPPYVITEDEIDLMLDIAYKSIEKVLSVSL
ncbi:MAG: adenosylmethionine--8-amino-7-oxononanoate transaminase [Candidatus Gastranaerophilales bacterium]|nr:adenosylmethionine--8-amino-7-oxononanoate transaminase [Candidatus Gastranaerophilales bacterium]